MATRQVLAELGAAFEQRSGCAVVFESVGGVDAAKRVAAGEVFDLVVLASDAIDKLIAAGHLHAGSRVDLVRSGVAVAVRAGAPVPDIGSEDALKRAVLAARGAQAAQPGPGGVGQGVGPQGIGQLGASHLARQLAEVDQQGQSPLELQGPGLPVDPDAGVAFAADVDTARRSGGSRRGTEICIGTCNLGHGKKL